MVVNCQAYPKRIKDCAWYFRAVFALKYLFLKIGEEIAARCALEKIWGMRWSGQPNFTYPSSPGWI